MRDTSAHSHGPVALCDLLDRLLETGVVALGEAKLTVADVELIYVGLKLVITTGEQGRDRMMSLVPPGPRPDDGCPDGSVEDRQHEPRVALEPLTGGQPASSTPLRAKSGNASRRKRPGPREAARGLGQLVLSLVKLLHELLERQALRRMEAGALDADQIEKLGLTLMRQAEAIEVLRNAFGLQPGDLNLDLGPLGKLF